MAAQGHGPITLTQVLASRVEMNRRIRDAVTEFSRETGLIVDKISLYDTYVSKDGPLYNVKSSVPLP